MKNRFALDREFDSVGRRWSRTRIIRLQALPDQTVLPDCCFGGPAA